MFWVMNVSGRVKDQSEIKVDCEPDEMNGQVISDMEFYPIDVKLSKGNAQVRIYLTRVEAETLNIALIRRLGELDRIDIERKFG